MKRIHLTRILFFASALLMLQTAKAQSNNDLDSVKYAIERQAQLENFNKEQGAKDAEEAEKLAVAEAEKLAEQESFKTVMNFLFINRYRNPHKHVYARGAGQNWSMGVYTDQPIPFIATDRTDLIGNYNFHWGGFVAKSFDPANSVRLSYDYANNSLANDMFAIRHQVGVDYLWDMSNYFYGYNEARRWSFSYLAGIDFGHNTIANTVNLYGGLHTGVQVRANLSPRTYLLVEPRISAYTNDEVFEDWHKVDVRGHVLVGLGVRLSSPYKPLQWNYDIDKDSVSLTDNFFIQLSMGAFDSFRDMRENNFGEMGPALHFAAGRWLNPKLAVRASLYAEQLDLEYRNRRAGGMVEGVLNIPELFGFSMGRFGLEASAGVRYDRTCWALFQWGSSSSVQLKYFLNQQFALFADTRFSSMYNDEHDRYDRYGNLNLGIEFYRSNYHRYHARKMTSGNVDYKKGLVLSYAYGQQYPFLMGGDWLATLNSTFQASLAYRFDDLHALRLKFEHTNFELYNTWHGTPIKPMCNWITFNPQYMFNLTNAWTRNTNHRFDLRPFIGAVYSITEEDFFSYGVEVGAQAALKLAPSFELFVEPSYRYMTADGLKQCIHWDKGFVSMSAGLNVVLGPDKSRKEAVAY